VKKPSLYLNGVPIGEVSSFECSLMPNPDVPDALDPYYQWLTLTIHREPTLKERVASAFGDTDPRIPEFRDRAN